MAGIYEVTEAFNGLLEIVPVYREQEGSFVEGEWTKKEYTPTAYKGIIQPTPVGDLKKVSPDGDLTIMSRTLWVTDLVDTVNPMMRGDLFAHKGEYYEIIGFDDWLREGGFLKAIGKRINKKTLTDDVNRAFANG